jgi:hypothetical protein
MRGEEGYVIRDSPLDMLLFDGQLRKIAAVCHSMLIVRVRSREPQF